LQQRTSTATQVTYSKALFRVSFYKIANELQSMLMQDPRAMIVGIDPRAVLTKAQRTEPVMLFKHPGFAALSLVIARHA
jgi:hypothetical protein